MAAEEAEVCKRLKLARLHLGLSQSEISRRLALPAGSLTNYEYQKAPVRAVFGLKFCHILIINERWLATGIGPIEPCVGLYSCFHRTQASERDSFRQAFIDNFAKLHDEMAQNSPASLLNRLLSCPDIDPARIDRIWSIAFSHFTTVVETWNIEKSAKQRLARKRLGIAVGEDSSTAATQLIAAAIASMDRHCRQYFDRIPPPLFPQ